MDIGLKIKELRLMNQLTQEELADRAELSKGFISQIENDLTSPSIATLVDILQCLGTDLKDFFSEQEDHQVVFDKTDYFIKEDEELMNSIEWMVPNAQKNSMEPIKLTLNPGGKTIVDQPHEGEEFGYMLKGSVEICIGNEKYKAKKGASFYFLANKPHYIENIGAHDAVLIWVSSPPSF